MKNICLLLVFFLVGCATGTQINSNVVNQIQNGVTTETQIRQWFGEPVALSTNKKANTRTLYYGYENTDELKNQAGTLTAAAAGGVVGSQFGGGTGSVILGSLGAVAAGAVANNLITVREEHQKLTVIINSSNGVVIDHNFTESKNRSQRKSFNSGVSPL